MATFVDHELHVWVVVRTSLTAGTHLLHQDHNTRARSDLAEVGGFNNRQLHIRFCKPSDIGKRQYDMVAVVKHNMHMDTKIYYT